MSSVRGLAAEMFQLRGKEYVVNKSSYKSFRVFTLQTKDYVLLLWEKE